MEKVQRLSVDEALGMLEHRIAEGLDAISSKLESDIHNPKIPGARLQDRVQGLYDRLGRVQSGIDEVVMLQRLMIQKLEAASNFEEPPTQI